LILALLLAIRSTWELCDLLKTRDLHPAFGPCATGAALVVAAAWIPHWPVIDGMSGPMPSAGCAAAAFVISVLALFAAAAARFEAPGKTIERLGSEVLAISYCGLLLAATAQLRWIGGGTLGYVALGSLVIATKAGDIGAYSLGRLLGKRKMAPRLSPGKTWAGFVGALLGAMLGASVWLWWSPPTIEGYSVISLRALGFGLVMGVVGLMGDLCESLIKRDVGRKDAAALMPGFGGLLDLLDSVIYAGPVAWLWWILWPPVLPS
jgi:phosphatidate cytidylyltransferase